MPPRSAFLWTNGRVITKAVTNGLAPLLEGLPAGGGDGVGLLHLLNGTSSSSSSSSSVLLAVGPSGTAVSELEVFPPAGAAKSVALTLRDGGVAWGRGQELWLCLGDGDGDEDVGGGGRDALSKKEQQQQEQRRGSSRYDFQVLWSAPMVDVVGSNSSSNGGSSSSSNGGSSSDGRGSEGVVQETGSSGSGMFSGSAGSADEPAGQGEEQGEGREAEGAGRGHGAGPLGGHVVGELRPLNEFSAARQEALDEVRWLPPLKHDQAKIDATPMREEEQTKTNRWRRIR